MLRPRTSLMACCRFCECPPLVNALIKPVEGSPTRNSLPSNVCGTTFWFTMTHEAMRMFRSEPRISGQARRMTSIPEEVGAWLAGTAGAGAGAAFKVPDGVGSSSHERVEGAAACCGAGTAAAGVPDAGLLGTGTGGAGASGAGVGGAAGTAASGACRAATSAPAVSLFRASWARTAANPPGEVPPAGSAGAAVELCLGREDSAALVAAGAPMAAGAPAAEVTGAPMPAGATGVPE